MSSYVPLAMRRAVAERAGHICEYCLIHEEDAFLGCEIEHIISAKHGGKTALANLAWACAICNRNKGTDIATLAPASGQLCRLFNPRTDRWGDHFKLRGLQIFGSTDVGAVTVALLHLNALDRLTERRALTACARWPSPEALRFMRRK